jgi:hypothetical protein
MQAKRLAFHDLQQQSKEHALPGKPLTLRSFVILGAAAAVGSAAGTVVQSVAVHADFNEPSVWRLATAITTLWAMEKLNALIAHSSSDTETQ